MIAYDKLLERFKSLLKESGLKFTKQRECILSFLYKNSAHYTPEQIYSAIKEANEKMNIGIATVYRTLSLLESAGIASSISFGTKGKKYELGVKKHHDHIICVECGDIVEFVDDTIEHRQEQIAKKYGFKMTDHTMKIVGVCGSCQER